MSFWTKGKKSKKSLIFIFFGLLCFLFVFLFKFYWSRQRGLNLYRYLKEHWTEISSDDYAYTRGLPEILIRLRGLKSLFSFSFHPDWSEWEFSNFGPSGFILSQKSWIPFAKGYQLAFLPQGRAQQLLETISLDAEQPSHLKAFFKLIEESQEWEKAYHLLSKGGPSCVLQERSSRGLCDHSRQTVPVWDKSYLGCYPVGIREPKKLEVFESDDQRCVYWFELNPDFYDYPIHSKLHCLNHHQNHLESLPFDRIQAIFPTNKSEIYHLYEGHYQPPQVRKLKIENKISYQRQEALSDQRQGFHLLGSVQPGVSTLPLREHSVYRCHHNDVESQKREVSWVYAPSEFFHSHRHSLRDLQFGVSFLLVDNLEFHLVDGEKLVSIYPDLGLLPKMDCLFSTILDARCGETVLRYTANLVWDLKHNPKILSTLSHKLLASTVLLSTIFLSIVDHSLQQWSLETQTKLLKSFLEKRLSETQKKFLETLKSFFPTQTIRNQAPSDFDLLGFPETFWSSLSE
jgi:hypothetical protein